MSSDRSWMQHRFDERNNITNEYKNGVKEFIDFAIKRKDTHGNIRCPCNECENLSFHQPERVTHHLYRYGIMESYTTWDLHKETNRSRVVLPSRLYGASSRGGVGRGRGDGGRDRGGEGRGRGDDGRDKGKVVIIDGEMVRGGGERVIGGGERGRGDGGRDKGKGKVIGGKRKEDGGRGRVSVDESDSDNDSDYECEDERLKESDDEIEGGEEADGYDGMEVEDDMEGEDEMGGEYTFERAARIVCFGDYKTPPKKGDPKLGVVEFIDDKT
ncbi:hypothetical protein POM88_040945 [Heracleum sosnowskyi]|uniref:Transposase-associated domain-containing protein n=1 Tax=Heracleum sosnowskyi TaxID=360622 RepID=A0AAD8HFI7_9APIA|nr:hypothetical protein POM88_040945 [Heracleum sosnowskyi]